MITPIFMPIETPRQPTEREQVDEAARGYSTSEEVRAHFRAGAEFEIEKNKCDFGFIEFLCIFLFFYCLVCGFIGFLNGCIGDYSDRAKFNRPADYIFFPESITKNFMIWAKKESGK